MTDERPRTHDAEPLPPRPQYGEYATPEEQRARIRQPDATWELEHGHAAPAEEPAAAPAGTVAPVTPVRAATPRRFDRVATLVLLGYGLFTVLTRIPAFMDYAAFADSMFQILGIDVELSDPEGAAPWGIAAAAALAVAWILAALASWASLKAGRLSWWIPVVAGIAANLVAGYLMVVPLASDPVVWSALQQAMLG